MAKDERYTPHNLVPEELVTSLGSDKVFSPGFSIRGKVNAGGWMDPTTTNDNNNLTLYHKRVMISLTCVCIFNNRL